MGSENLIGRISNAATAINNRFQKGKQSGQQFDFTDTTRNAVADKAARMINEGSMTSSEAVAATSLPAGTKNYILGVREAAHFAERTGDTESAQLNRDTLAAMLRYQSPGKW
ncbi:MAG: hypothetical protein BGO05_11420 [Rhizobiales bacterium 63-7]|nr:hypothetical protein [Hyphomicrobiales bacterium]OJU70456.1 MAG: hypothetical protein BGO05_11420 [Rhizobiales bacterium 63-7]